MFFEQEYFWWVRSCFGPEWSTIVKLKNVLENDKLTYQEPKGPTEIC